jgi:hypothetical protein
MTTTPTELRSKCRSFTEEAIRTWVNIMRDIEEPAVARSKAAEALMDRGWGKPAQAQAGPDGEGPVRIEIAWANVGGPPAAAD